MVILWNALLRNVYMKTCRNYLENIFVYPVVYTDLNKLEQYYNIYKYIQFRCINILIPIFGYYLSLENGLSYSHLALDHFQGVRDDKYVLGKK
ncbi:hypothetical protein SAMN02746098_00525 [Desulfosporosinus lacus DSM 15449]|uniref:Uncharacterized protein n=1 Tax=Desulfosporosinus lacus DSM 15449 TaxID=1121420 RepID=A0A1M5RD71_9FIRM|nr:hypothetical protein SAMN02746098_00525 [Desulfosporosinus lacus DSM 15449]